MDTFKMLQIAFKMGIKAAEEHPEDDDCDDVYFDRAVAIINRLRLNTFQSKRFLEKRSEKDYRNNK